MNQVLELLVYVPSTYIYAVCLIPEEFDPAQG